MESLCHSPFVSYLHVHNAVSDRNIPVPRLMKFGVLVWGCTRKAQFNWYPTPYNIKYLLYQTSVIVSSSQAHVIVPKLKTKFHNFGCWSKVIQQFVFLHQPEMLIGPVVGPEKLLLWLFDFDFNAMQLDHWHFKPQILYVHLEKLSSEAFSAHLSFEEPIKAATDWIKRCRLQTCK